MGGFLLDAYAWIKALHIIAVIAWMAGMLYLPRLYVYHTNVGQASAAAGTFKVMEEKLLRIIMNPAMIATWLFGLLMVWGNPALLSEGWFHAKLLLIILMTGFHGFLAAERKKFAADQNERPEKFWRLANEGPTLLMVGIVLLAIVKPF